MQVATSQSGFESPDLWDTGKVESTNVSTVYAGAALGSRSAAWWRVMVWDYQDEPSAWSEPDSFELALTEPTDWSANWITNQDYIPAGGSSLPVFAKTFNIDSSVTKARLYLIGLGQYSASLNGQPVSDSVLAPGYSQTNNSLPYGTYNVTSLLQEGANFLGIGLGKGVYDAEVPLQGRYTDFDTVDNPLTLITQLEVSFANGSIARIVSDESWKTSVTGPQLESSWYGGEEYDARKEFPGWPTTAVDTSAWTNASIIAGPAVNGSLLADPGPALKIVDSWKAVTVTQINATTWVFDLGINFAGWYNLTMSGEAGQRVVFWPGEFLTDGLVNQSSTGEPIFDGYTFAGRDSEWYAPRFMYHGFRYLQVDNLTNPPSVNDLEALVIRADNEQVSSFNTDVDLFNSIHTNIDRSIQSNMYSVLTDCPHREKSGWLEQDHLVFDPLARSYDIQAYVKRFVSIIAAGQQSDGMIPTTAPEFKVFIGGTLGIYRDEPNWGNTMILTPLELYQTYGDSDLLEEYYEVMAAYVNYLSSKTNGTYTLDYGLGDWETFDSSTPLGITSTMGYAQAVAGMSCIATILGRTADAAMYSTLSSKILSAFHSFFFNATSEASYGSGSQASNAIALDLGAVPSTYEPAVLNTLLNTLSNDGNHFTVGEIGLPSLIRTLVTADRNDLLYDIMTLTTNASYGFQAINGATSLWEDWDGVFRTTGSLNHWMFGYGDTWLIRLSGLMQAPGSVAWKEILFHPNVVGSLTSASSSYRTPRGWANASWTLDVGAGVLNYDVTVPVGAMGKVVLSSGIGNTTEGEGTTLEETEGVLWVQEINGSTNVGIGSGSYSFRAAGYGSL